MDGKHGLKELKTGRGLWEMNRTVREGRSRIRMEERPVRTGRVRDQPLCS